MAFCLDHRTNALQRFTAILAGDGIFHFNKLDDAFAGENTVTLINDFRLTS
ncbi:unannotated protein [freshwater metagenome]|uniref:Unannotated protein n=1 Tax=freshwater metagenome TaxID=449393 RepID=A0A6J7SA74_9ZZZZ